MRTQSKTCNHNPVQTLIVGALAGGLLGLGTALLVAPKSGKQLRQDICDACHNVAEGTHGLKESLLKQGEEFIEAAQQWTSPQKESGNLNLVVGGVAGGLIFAAATAFLLSQKSGRNLTKSFTENIKEFSHCINGDFTEKAGCWVHKAKNILDTLHTAMDTEKTSQKSTSEGHNLNQVLDLANIGFRLFQGLKQRR